MNLLFRQNLIIAGMCLLLNLYANPAYAILDAVFANEFGEANRVCLGDGTGGFTCSDVASDDVLNDSQGVALGDVNGDNILDAVFANRNDPNRVCRGDGTGGFTCEDVASDDTNRSRGVALGDVNGDNILDAVFANLGEANRVCRGDGTGGFTCSDVASADTNDSQGVALGDVGAIRIPVCKDLDIDGNGTADALSDGILIIRYLFGFLGDALVDGAVAPNCTRCSAPQIEECIEDIMP